MLKRMLIGLSVLLNVVVIVAAVTLYASPMSVLRMFLGDFVALSYERWTSQFEHLEIQAGDVVFLGDSITEGGAWDELFPGVPVRNRGIGGDTTSGVLDRLDQITRGRPAKVFLKIGTNADRRTDANLLEREQDHEVDCFLALGLARGQGEKNEQDGHANAVVEAALDVEAGANAGRHRLVGHHGLAERGIGGREHGSEEANLEDAESVEQ